MDNKKIAKVEADIAKTKAKLAELQALLKDQERQKLELENTNIVDMVRGLNISLADLPALLQKLSGGNAATSGQFGPKSEPRQRRKRQMNKRRVTAALAAVLLSLSFSTVAYAGGGSYEDCPDQPPTATVELPPIEEQPAEKPFTPDGTATVIDNATDEEGKEFFTIMTPSENVFYLVIDRQRTSENVYFLNAVTEADLLALAEPAPEPEPTPTPEPLPEPPTEEQPEEKPAQKGGGMLWLILLLAAGGGGAAYYFKVLRPKQQANSADDLDEAEYMDEQDNSPPWYEDEPDTEEGGE